MAQQTITRESFEHIDGKLNGTLSATEKKFLRDNASIANTKVLEDDFGVKDIAKNAKEGKPIDQEKRAVLQTYLFAKGAYKNIPNNTGKFEIDGLDGTKTKQALQAFDTMLQEEQQNMQDIENGKNTDIYRLNLDATTLDGIWTAIDNGQQYFYGWDDQGKIHRIAIQDGKNIHQKLMGDYTNQAGKYEPLWQNVEEPLPNALHAKNHYERDKVNTIKKLDLKIDKNGLYTREKHKGIYAFADDGTLYYSGKSEGNKVYDLKEDKRNSINKPQEAFPQDLLAAAIERGTVENSA